MLWLDSYERRCRLAPGLFALLPLTVVVTALGLRHAAVVSVAISVLSLAFGPVLVASVVRKFGYAAQDELWRKWGGAPTTRFLRTREAQPNPVQQDIWRKGVEGATHVTLLSPRAEKGNPKKADDTIAAAIAKVRTMTDSNAFPKVKAEVRNYGFERNLYGCRVAGRIIATMSVIVIAAAAGWRVADGLHPSVPIAYTLAVIIDVLILITWFVAPSAERTRVVAEQYAHQLLQGAVTLSDAASSGPSHTTIPGNTE
jgi:hypothetical protein